MIAYVNSDNVVHFDGGYTTSLTTGERVYLNAAATVEFTVQTAEYVNVPGQNWPASMTWISGSNGNFLGVLHNEVELHADTEYRLIATVDNGLNQHGEWDLPVHARQRG